MQKIRIRLPAVVTNVGPGYHTLGLAVGLYVTVEMIGRSDEQWVLETRGETSSAASPLKHPVALGMGRFFQYIERALLGVSIRVDNQIPLGSGLGAETSMMLAGILGANYLMGDLYPRAEVLEIAADILRADTVVTAVFGGLTASVLNDSGLIYRTMPVTQTRVIVVVPELEHYRPPVLGETLATKDALVNLHHMPMFVDALRTGDTKLLRQVCEDRLLAEQLSVHLSGYEKVIQAAEAAGGLVIAISNGGPALVALAESRHERIADEMRVAWRSVGITARTWVLNIDTQGIVVSAMQSS